MDHFMAYDVGLGQGGRDIISKTYHTHDELINTMLAKRQR